MQPCGAPSLRPVGRIAERTTCARSDASTLLARPRLLRCGAVARKVDVTELVGAAEIAKRLGSNRRQLVTDWRRRHPDFPQPVAQLEMGNVWAWPDIEAWAKRTGRL